MPARRWRAAYRKINVEISYWILVARRGPVKRAQASASSRRKPRAESDAVLDGEPAPQMVPEPRQVRLVGRAHGVGAGR